MPSPVLAYALAMRSPVPPYGLATPSPDAAAQYKKATGKDCKVRKMGRRRRGCGRRRGEECEEGERRWRRGCDQRGGSRVQRDVRVTPT
eukprot:2196557-Rhodomonas_salina.2